MPIKRRRFLAVACLAPLCLAVTGCSSGSADTEEAKKQTQSLSEVLQKSKGKKTGK